MYQGLGGKYSCHRSLVTRCHTHRDLSSNGSQTCWAFFINLDPSAICHKLNINQAQSGSPIGHEFSLVFPWKLIEPSTCWARDRCDCGLLRETNLTSGTLGSLKKLTAVPLTLTAPRVSWGLNAACLQQNQSPLLSPQLGCAWDFFRLLSIFHPNKNQSPRSLFSEFRKADVFAYFSFFSLLPKC